MNLAGSNKMNGKAVAWIACLGMVLTLSGASLAEDSSTVVKRVAMTPDIKSDPKQGASKQSPAVESAHKTCINQCNIANGQCNSEVRQARQECSRKAANSGRDPMTMRNEDYGYFCNYFRNSGRANARFPQHYDVCVDVMQKNIASMRYDCYRNERDAQNVCRTELRQCQSDCP